MDKYQKVMQYLANNDSARAGETFHDIVVAEALKIYESVENPDEELEDEDEIGGDAADNLIADVSVVEPGNSMEEAKSEKSTKKKNSPYRSEVVPNAAKLVPAPQPVNKQAEQVNNLTPFPRVN